MCDKQWHVKILTQWYVKNLTQMSLAVIVDHQYNFCDEVT